MDDLAPNGRTWTAPLVLQYLKMLLEANDEKYEQRFLAQEKAVQSALQAAREATTKAENAAEKRFDSDAEIRAVLTDQSRNFPPRQEVKQTVDALTEKVEVILKNLTEKIDGVSARVGLIEGDLKAMRGHSTGLSDGWKILLGVAGFVVTLLTIYFMLSPN